MTQSKAEGAITQQRDSIETASISAMTILTTQGLASALDLEGVIESKAMKAVSSGLNCVKGLSSTYQPLFKGAVTVAGDCKPTGTDSCSYDFDGSILFDALLIGPGRFLNGTGEASFQLSFENCVTDLNNSTMYLNFKGPVQVGELEIRLLNAVFSSTVDPASGATLLKLESINSYGTFRGLNCLSSLTSTSCFVDADNDLINDDVDNCPGLFNQNQTDTDGDGVGDACDNCPINANADQTDGDADGRGDLCANICAPEVELCATSDDCPVELLCQNGCCLGSCPDTISPFINLSCRQAEAINASNGIDAGCEAFGHACNPDVGCCQFEGLPENPENICTTDLVNFTCGQGSGYGPDLAFCNILFNYVCYVFPDPSDEGCPPLREDIPVNFDCSEFGQPVCNEAIGIGFGSTQLTCNGRCCVEPSP